MLSPRRSVRPGLGALAIALATLFTVAPSRAQPGDKISAPAPKELGAEDSRRVDALKQTIDRLRRAGKFTEALEPAHQVLAICEKALGPDHWHTADARREVDTLKLIAGLPEEGRKAMASVGVLDDRHAEMQEKARYAEAERVCRELVAILERWLGADHPDTAKCYNDLAVDIYLQGRYGAAEPLYRRALAIYAAALGDGHYATATAAGNLALNLDGQGRFAEAEPLHRQALAIKLRTLGADHPRTATGYIKLASNLDSQGRHAEAEPLCRRALAIRLKALGEGHPDTAAGYGKLAFNLDAQGRYVEAEPLHRKALAICRAALGEGHPDIAARCRKLADNLDAQGKFAEAEPLYRQALAICRTVLGDDHPDTGECYNDLAADLYAQGRYDEAEPLYRRALAICRAALGDGHYATARACSNLALDLDAQGKPAEAEPLHRRALAIYAAALGDGHYATATAVGNLAVDLDAQGKPAEAEPLHRQALAIKLRTLGADHPDTATGYGNLAANLGSQGRYAEAEPLCRQALAIDLAALGEVHPDTATGYGKLASNLDEQGRHAEAEPLYRRALAIRLKVLGEGHPDTATSYNNLAADLYEQGRYGAAEPLYRRALAIRLKVLGEVHPDTAASCDNLAADLYAQGRYVEAEPLCRRALAIRLKALGEEHPSSVIGYNNLAFNLDAQGRSAEAIRCWESAVHGLEAGRFAAGAIGLEQALLREGLTARPAVAMALARQGRPGEAWRRWEDALARGLLDDLSARQLRPLTHDERQRETDLLGQLQKLDEQVGRLAPKVNRTQDEDRRLDSLRQQQSALRSRFVAMENELKARYGDFAGKPAPLDEIRAALPVDAALVGWVDSDPEGPPDRDRSPYHWACLVRREGEPLWMRIPGTGANGTWIGEDARRPAALRAALRNPRPDWRDLAAALARQRLGPLRPHLDRIRHLIVLPSPDLAGVPIEVLIDAQPADAPRPTVSYAPSGTLFARLARPRNGPAGPLRLLALGDPAFPPPEPETPPPPPDHGLALLDVVPHGLADLAGLRVGDVLLEYNGLVLKSAADLQTVPAESGAGRIPVRFWRHGEIRTALVAAGRLGIRLDPKRKAAEVLLARRASEEVLQPRTRGASWDRLPGTRREIEAIAGLFAQDRVTALLGDQATESALQGLAATGRL